MKFARFLPPLKWTALVVTSTLFLVWGISGWVSAFVPKNQYVTWAVFSGRIQFNIYPDGNGPIYTGPAIQIRKNVYWGEFFWTYYSGTNNGFQPATQFTQRLGVFHIPLWWIVVPVFGTTCVLWRTDAKRRKLQKQNCCVHCGYSLIGHSTGATCPECGSTK